MADAIHLVVCVAGSAMPDSSYIVIKSGLIDNSRNTD
jgi:hypothetical protein